jgi:hypothetical protein
MPEVPQAFGHSLLLGVGMPWSGRSAYLAGAGHIRKEQIGLDACNRPARTHPASVISYHGAWQSGQAHTAAFGGADRRAAKIAAAPLPRGGEF